MSVLRIGRGTSASPLPAPHLAVLMLLAALAFACSTNVRAQTASAGSISIESAWSRETPGGASVAAGYLTIKNSGAAPDRLLSVSSEIAGHAQIHEMSMADGVMKMREVTDGLPIPANGEVVLDPEHYHLMFTELKRPLKQGEEFSATLDFEKAGPVQATFEVEGVGAGAPGMAAQPGMGMKPGMQMKQ